MRTAPEECPLQNGNLIDTALFVENSTMCETLCASNERCNKGQCMLTCRVDNDCFLGHVCLNKMCLVGCR